MRLRTIDDITYLVPIGGDWNSSPALIELNEVGAFIIESLPCTFDELIDAVTSEFDVSQATAADDTQAFLSDLLQMKLIDTD